MVSVWFPLVSAGFSPGPPGRNGFRMVSAGFVWFQPGRREPPLEQTGVKEDKETDADMGIEDRDGDEGAGGIRDGGRNVGEGGDGDVDDDEGRKADKDRGKGKGTGMDTKKVDDED